MVRIIASDIVIYKLVTSLVFVYCGKFEYLSQYEGTVSIGDAGILISLQPTARSTLDQALRFDLELW